MSPEPLPTRVALLEQQSRSTAATVNEIKTTVEEIRDLLAERRGSERVMSNMRHLITVIVSGSIAGLISLATTWPPPTAGCTSLGR
jgi:hypothetical protein